MTQLSLAILPGNVICRRYFKTLSQSAQTQVLKHLQAANANASPGLRAFWDGRPHFRSGRRAYWKSARLSQ